MNCWIGKNIKKSADELLPVSLSDIAAQISGDTYLRDAVYRYRRTINIHADAARHLKSTLPYIIAAEFKEHFRKMEALIQAFGLFIDIDGMVTHEVELDAWKSKLAADRRIALMYVSPSGLGLKLLYFYDTPIAEARAHTILYKKLVAELEEKYALTGLIDKTTSDVTRVSFLSHDRDVFMNADAAKLNTSYYLNQTLHPLQIPVEIPLIQSDPKSIATKIQNDMSTSSIDYAAILAKLGKKVRHRGSVPNMGSTQLDERMPAIEKGLQHLGISILALEDIAYGKKMRVTDGHYWAEVNLFYGKRGFTVAGVPKRDSYGPLMQVAIGIAESVLFSISISHQDF